MLALGSITLPVGVLVVVGQVWNIEFFLGKQSSTLAQANIWTSPTYSYRHAPDEYASLEKHFNEVLHLLRPHLEYRKLTNWSKFRKGPGSGEQVLRKMVCVCRDTNKKWTYFLLLQRTRSNWLKWDVGGVDYPWSHHSSVFLILYKD